MNNVSSRDILPLALDLCSAFLLAIQKKYIESLWDKTASIDAKPNIKVISSHYVSWINSLSKYTLKDIENFEILSSLLRLSQSYYLVFSMSMLVSCESKSQKYQMPLGESDIIEVLSLTVKWIIAAFKKEEASIVWCATNILQSITMLDPIADIFFNLLERDTMAELIILMLRKIGDHRCETQDSSIAYQERLLNTHISEILKKAYAFSKAPFIREIMGAFIRVYKIDELIDYSLEHGSPLVPTCGAGSQADIALI